jgi:hypothetical protein
MEVKMSRFKGVIVIFAVLILYAILAQDTIAWKNLLTHPAITKKAVDRSVLSGNYLKTQLGFSDDLNTPLELTGQFQNNINMRVSQERDFIWDYKTKVSILEWLRKGSSLEDVPNPRARHHFYDPIRNTGLNNSDSDPKVINGLWLGSKWFYPDYWGFNATGLSTLDRAKGLDGDWGNEYLNYYNWIYARDLFYFALTEQAESVRKAYLGSMFVTLGHICHLLEDMGVPAHTRNDFVYGHLVAGFYRDLTAAQKPWYKGGHPFEAWMETQIANNGGNIPSAYLDRLMATPPSFSKFGDYWDKGICELSGGAQWQGDNPGWPSTGFGEPPPEKSWGLAECSNYQFLSFSTVFKSSGLQSFPHPAKNHTRVDWYPTGPDGERQYYRLGYDVPHLARITYTTFYAYLIPIYTVETSTPEEERVYEDYAKRTIPRTIDYTTGLLNYFFRGKLEIEPNCMECNTVTFVIRNDSNNSGVQQTLKGGTFELFWDTRDGNRNEVNDFTIPGWTSSSELAYNNYVTGTFNKPDSNQIEKYTVVYKGQISENPAQPDEDDDEAIAVATLKMGYPIIAWGLDSYGQVSNVPEGNDFVDVAAGKYHGLAIKSDGSLVAWGSNDYGECNVPQGNNFVAISGGKWHSIALREDGSIVGFGDNTQNQIDVPEGNDFVAIASGDNHNLAIKNDGTIVGWGGYNTYGECDAPPPDDGTTYVAVSAGSYHSLALQSDGTVKAWGSNNMGQTRIYEGAGNDHEAIAAGGDYNFLLLTDDSLVYWGGGDWYQPGIPNYHWRMDGNDYVAIAAGGFHIAALTNDGQILSWGYNNYGSPPYPVPTGISFVKDLAAGWKFTVALKAR